MKAVKITLSKEIAWPDCCAICGQSASDHAYTHYRNIDGYYLVAVRETTHRISYPVCSKHKWVARFYGFVTNQAFATGMVMTITLPFLLAVPIVFTDLLDKKFHDATFISLYVGFASAVLYWKLRNPVKVVKVKNGVAKIRFANAQYADEFEKINANNRFRRVRGQSNNSSRLGAGTKWRDVTLTPNSLGQERSGEMLL